jgi:GNAT superfamily N-acetyltransferase
VTVRESRIETVALAERPHLREQMRQLDEVWPAFLKNDHAVRRYWGSLDNVFPELQVVLYDATLDHVIGKGHAIPTTWDGTAAGLPQGIDTVIKHGLISRPAAPDTLCALAVIVHPDRRGEGLSRLAIRAMIDVGLRHGLKRLLVPVRPTVKSRYPIAPIARYVEWRDRAGRVFDPWLRAHCELGGTILGIAHRSLVVRGSVAEWEAWTGMEFPASGPYVVPGALEPVVIDRERDEGRYEEPNVWVLHAGASK